MPRAKLVQIAIIAFLAITSCTRPAAESKRITIAASPEVAATGLPQLLIQTFQKEAHVATGFIVADKTAIERAARAGIIDVAIVNSADVVRALREMNHVRLESVFAYDDFIIAGPKRDVAGVRSSKTAAEAFRKIVKKRQRFCAATDVPGLHAREEEIWALANMDPKKERHYIPSRGTAAAVLDEASRLGAYTLTDRATFTSGQRNTLVALLDGTPMLHNDYVIVLLTPPAKNRNAEWFVQWLMSYRGREVVEGYRFDGGRRFFLTDAK